MLDRLFGNGLILGRSRALWVAALGSLASFGVLIGWWTLTQEQLAGVSLVIFTVTGLLANADDPRTVPTLAASITPPQPTGASPSGHASGSSTASLSMTDPNGAERSDPIADPIAGGDTGPSAG